MIHPDFIFTAIGYVGSLLILSSFLMISDLKMRIFNMIGSLALVLYSLFFGLYPLALLGLVINLIHFYRLFRNMNQVDLYTLVPVTREEPFYQYFLSYHEEDIRHFFPDFQSETPYDLAFLVCLNSQPVGIFLAQSLSDYELSIVLDYAIPQYRDYSVGRFLFRQLSHMGYHKAVFHGEYQKHLTYLKQMEFTKEGNTYVKTW